MNTELTEVDEVCNRASFIFHFYLRMVEGVMAAHDDQSNDQDQPKRKIHHDPKNDHAHSNGPDHLQYEQVIVWIEGPSECDDENFCKHQPQPSCDKECTQFRFCFLPADKKSRSARKKNKN